MAIIQPTTNTKGNFPNFRYLEEREMTWALGDMNGRRNSCMVSLIPTFPPKSSETQWLRHSLWGEITQGFRTSSNPPLAEHGQVTGAL